MSPLSMITALGLYTQVLSVVVWSYSIYCLCVAMAINDNTIDLAPTYDISLSTATAPATIRTDSSGFTTSVDSTTSTSSTVVMTSSRTIIVTTPPIDIRQEQNDDDGSDVGGIVAGCVVAFILIIVIVVCLVIFLIWYRAKKKRDHTTASGMCDMYNYICR